MTAKVYSDACEESKVSIVSVQNQTYHIVSLHSSDEERHAAYQELRAQVFVHQLAWDIPLDAYGRERDHYDQTKNPFIQIHCVYGISENSSYLLGGIRLFELQNWESSMVCKEFFESHMFSASVIRELQAKYNCRELLELTRFCIQRTKHPPYNLFSTEVVRDLTYSAVYRQIEITGRHLALVVADSVYLRILQRSHFQLDILYEYSIHSRKGYALAVIDLKQSISAMRAAHDRIRVKRMLTLCKTKWP